MRTFSPCLGPAFSLWPGLLGAVLFTLLSSPQPAQACLNSSRSVSQVLGVAPDGTFAVHEETESEASDEEPTIITVFDAGGYKQVRLSIDRREEEAQRIWKIEGKGDWKHETSSRGKPASVAQVEAAVRRRFRLTPLRPSPMIAYVPARTKGCGPVVLRTPDGEVPLQDLGTIVYADENACVPVQVKVFEHPSSALLFTHIRYVVPLDEERTTEVDRVFWFRPNRLAGLRAAERGRQALERRDYGRALASFEESFALVPGFIPARLWAARALAASQTGQEQAQRFLSAPIPDPELAHCFGGSPDDVTTWFEHHAPANWGALADWPEEAKPWESCPPQSEGLNQWYPADDTFPQEDSSPSEEEVPPEEPDTDPDVTDPCMDFPDTQPEPADSPPASPAPWSPEPRSVFLGALAILAFVVGWRRGVRP